MLASEAKNWPGCGPSALRLESRRENSKPSRWLAAPQLVNDRPPVSYDGRSNRTFESGGAHRLQEFGNLDLETVAVARQQLRRGEHVRRGGLGLGRAALHV